MVNSILEERIENRIFIIRGQKVMLDFDLATLYQVDTRDLKRAVRRNIKRFPADFMFVLTRSEYNSLRCQIGTLEKGKHAKYLPYAFTEPGIAMLSSVLHSERAVQVNIVIMRTFIRLRHILFTHKALARKIAELEKKYSKHEGDISVVFKVLKRLMILLPADPEKPKNKIGFLADRN